MRFPEFVPHGTDASDEEQIILQGSLSPCSFQPGKAGAPSSTHHEMINVRRDGAPPYGKEVVNGDAYNPNASHSQHMQRI